MARLTIRNLKKSWRSHGRRFDLEVERLEVESGEVVAIVGPSGSGKSTLLEVIGGATLADEVECYTISVEDQLVDMAALIHARDLSRLGAVRAAHLGFVLQTGGLLPYLSLDDNIALAQELAGRPDSDHTDALLDKLEIRSLRSHRPAALSVGQQQRAAIARALAGRPALVLADEPTAALDPPNKARVIECLTHAATEIGTSVVIASHETALLSEFGIATIGVDCEAWRDGAVEHVLSRVVDAEHAT